MGKLRSITWEELEIHRIERSISTQDLLMETSAEMDIWLSGHGLTAVGEVLEFDPDQLDTIREMANRISDAEEEAVRAIYGETGFFDGGDMCDYDGSWIVELVDSIKNYLEKNPEPVVDDQKTKLIQQWRRNVCTGDDVECGAYDLAQLIVAHLNEPFENEHPKLSHPDLASVTEVSGNSDATIELLMEVENRMIDAALEKIYEIENRQ